MKAIFQVFSICFICLLAEAGYTQQNWELKKDKNNIKVFTRKLSEEKFKEVKVTAELPGTYKQLVAIILDVKNHKKWVYRAKDAYPLKKDTSSPFIYYNRFSLPGPFKDRDMVLEVRYSNPPQDSKPLIHIKSIPGYLAEKKDIIRVPKLSALWEIVPLPDKKMQVTYTLLVDPGGDLPPALYNLLATEGPYDSFMELSKILHSKNIH
jgi:START domain